MTKPCGILDRSSDGIVPSGLYGHKPNRAKKARRIAPVENAVGLKGHVMLIAPDRLESAIAALITLARPARGIVAFTGAGISTESGIPDYRGPGGVWERNTPPTLHDFQENLETRRTYWLERRARYPALRDTKPNAGHLALARLQRAGRLTQVITQNIDGLHQKSGSDPATTIELHGSAHTVRCLDCGATWPADIVQLRLETEPLPACIDCGGPLRAATVLFGEALPAQPLRRAIAAARACDLMLVVGSSLVVQPAARLPGVALASGARLAIVNNEPTPLDDLAHVVVRAGAGRVLTLLADALIEGDQLAGAG